MNRLHLNIAVFCMVLILLGGITVLSPDGQIRIESENRMTKAMPEFSLENLFSGEYYKEFDDFFADNFVMRSTFVATSKKMKSFKGLALDDQVELVEYEGANVDQELNSVQEGVQDSKWGKILIYNNAAMELNNYNEDAAKKYAESINDYADRFANVNVYSLLVPTQVEFVDDDKYRSLSVPQSETIASTQSFFNEKVIPVNIHYNLESHKDEYIYFRTDHHWTLRGAFYGYQVFAQLLGERKPLLSDYKKTNHGNFLGSLYNITLNENLLKNPDFIELFDSQIPHKYFSLGEKIQYNEGQVFVRKWLDEEEKYAVCLGGDQPIVKIETNQNFGRNILVLKDSYANALIPYLLGVADNIVVIDPRLFDGKVDDIITQHSITDVLFVNYALITRWDGYSELYTKLLK